MRGPPSTQMTARAPIACARISLATCAILLACAARRVKRIACVRYSSCVSRFIVCRVACCALSCWLCCAVLSYGDALRWLCGAACCARSGGYLSLLLACLFCLRCSAPCGAVWCRGAGLLSAPPALRVMLCYCVTCHAAFTGFRLSVLRSAIRHPFGARLFRLRRARSAYLAIHITIVAFIII